MTNRQQTKRERQSEKKRLEREARIRRAKRRQRQRLVAILVVLAAAIAGGIVLAFTGSDNPGGFAAGGGSNCGDAEPESTSDPVQPGQPEPRYSEAPPMQIDCDLDYTATIKTNHGDIELKLYDNVAPVTVNNFVALARDGFYNGLTFHRVIPNFMIQGGDPLGTGSGGPGYRFQDEFDRHKNFDQPYRLAMANSGPATNGSQFFITVAPTEHLNQKHTIFGLVVSGQEVVDEISKVETSEGDLPVNPVTISEIIITESPAAEVTPSVAASAEASS